MGQSSINKNSNCTGLKCVTDVQIYEFTMIPSKKAQTHLSSLGDVEKPTHHFENCQIKGKNQVFFLSGMNHTLQYEIADKGSVFLWRYSS